MISFETNNQQVKNILIFLITSLPFVVQAQSTQAEYLEAKRQFALGNYESAQRSFSSLTKDNVFGPYASFYYALSAFKKGNEQQAYDMWKQTQINYPDWGQQKEVSYWLGQVAFSLEKYWEAFNHIESLPEDLKYSLIEQNLSNLPISKLKKAYALNPSNGHIGKYLSIAILAQPYSQRDNDLLVELSEKFEFESITISEELPEIKKDKYAIAAVLPFMFDSYRNPESVIRNSIIFNLYQGMEMARERLSEDGVNLEIFPYDTKKKGSEAQRIISDSSLAEADVIVGPLYGGPNRVISNYSKDKKITMINPVSSNGDIIGNNPFSFLFKPSYETQGRIAARYAKHNFQKNKLAFIFYETDRDSLVANAYKQQIEKDSFFVVRFERMTNESAQQVQKDFTEQFEVRLDTDFSREEMDSINLIPGRYVKTRPLRDKDDGLIIRDEEGEPVLEYYENRFNVEEDSIGHMFVASESNLLANNFISLSEVRSDTIGIIGYQEWLQFPTISYDQLERLNIAFISPDYFKSGSPQYEKLSKTFIEKIGREPDKYHFIGYELIYQLGLLLKEHGKYFQKGLRNGDFIPGELMKGLEYGSFNDNQVVPMTVLENLRLKDVTPKK